MLEPKHVTGFLARKSRKIFRSPRFANISKPQGWKNFWGVCLDIAPPADLQRNLRNRLDERLELVVARDKVGLAVHLYHRRTPQLLHHGGGDFRHCLLTRSWRDFDLRRSLGDDRS
jgi:hypothetical protein